MVGEILIKEANKIFKCDLLASSQVRNNVDGRVAVSYYLRIHSKTTFQKIGDLLKKDHGTIMHYMKLHDNLYRYNSEYKNKYDKLTVTHKYSKLFCNTCVFQFNKN
jgi:chromosomal replication initiation ATPase DnaA